MLGMPEARHALAEAAIYLATAPKSRTAADAIAAAIEDAERGDAPAVPEHLRDASYAGAARLGHGDGYEMPVSEAEGRAQEYVPGRREYYRPGEGGYEREVRERLARWDAAPTRESPEGEK
jgi:putative ATPase